MIMRPWDIDYNVVQEFTAILNKQIEWLDQLVDITLTDKGSSNPDNAPDIESVESFLNRYKDKGYWSEASATGLLNQYKDIHRKADALSSTKKSQKKDDKFKSDSTELRQQLVNFIYLINKLRDMSTLIAFGYDPFSGIKNKQQAMVELKKEGERKLRLEQNFSLLMMRIENLQEVEELFGPAKTEDFISKVCQRIENKLRIFDDMYRLDYNEFLFSIKLTDKAGAMLFARRMQNHFDKEHNAIAFEEHNLPLILSFCMAEPVANENFKQLLDLMRKDLSHAGPKGSIVQYVEQSPIERYVKEQLDS